MPGGVLPAMNVGSEAGAPLYLQLAAALRDDIVAGLFPVGSLLPTEEGLGERFGVSRHTVREALRLLREDGLVSSRRGAGTRVLAPAASGDIHQVMSINDLVAFAADTRLDIESIDTVTLDQPRAQRAGVDAGSTWLEVLATRRRGEDDAVLCRTTYYINRAYATVGRLLPRHQGPIFPLIEDLFGVSVAELHQEIAAVLLSPEQADGLGVEAGTAALQMRRTYRTSEGDVAQVTINTHLSSKFRYAITMRRVNGQAG